MDIWIKLWINSPMDCGSIIPQQSSIVPQYLMNGWMLDEELEIAQLIHSRISRGIFTRMTGSIGGNLIWINVGEQTVDHLGMDHYRSLLSHVPNNTAQPVYHSQLRGKSSAKAQFLGGSLWAVRPPFFEWDMLSSDANMCKPCTEIDRLTDFCCGEWYDPPGT